MPSSVRGRVYFDTSAPVPAGSSLHIIVEDVSRADASSSELAHAEIPVGEPSPRNGIDFEIATPNVNASARYEVRAHLSRGGRSAFSAGDQITTASHPVLTRGAPSVVDLRLQAI